MDISFIIVNWNTRELLIECIRSIYRTVIITTFEIWVVDNGSSDGSMNAVRTEFPDVRLIVNTSNMGFAKANNQALMNMKGRYALLLNTDAVLTDGAVHVLVNFMDNSTEAGVCGVQLLNADGSKQNSIANIPTLATELLNKSILQKLFPDTYLGKEHDFREPVAVDSVIGACMLVRKEAIDDAGFMDEAYFFFLEETDWCLAIRNHGWKIYHHPGVNVYHLQGRSAARVNIRARIEFWRSRYTFFRKHYGPAKLISLRVCLLIKLIVTILLNSFLLVFALFTSRRARQKLAVSFSILKWHLRGLPEGYGLMGSDIKP